MVKQIQKKGKGNSKYERKKKKNLRYYLESSDERISRVISLRKNYVTIHALMLWKWCSEVNAKYEKNKCVAMNQVQ